MLKTVLVVEDDRTMRELLRVHLTSAGHAVTSAANADEALLAARGLTPDLIICDVHMPRMNGFELVGALRKIPSLQDTPVIFLTVDGDAQEQGVRLGAAAYLTKPIRLETLLNAVAQHMPA